MCQASRIMWAIDAVKPYDAFSAAKNTIFPGPTKYEW